MSSCEDRAILDRYDNIAAYGWAYEDVMDFEFEVDDTSHYYQWFANLKISSDYPYSNIHLYLSTTAPDSSVRQEVVSIKLAEKNGKWLGQGVGRTISFQEAFPKRMQFDQRGIYGVKLKQYMRVDTLLQVKSAGIRIEKQEEIF